MEQFILGEVFAETRATPIPLRNDAASTIMLYGSEELKQRYLPSMIHSADIWCQGYSEPGAGSDLASLQTRAVRDGDDFVLNGVKIWTSGADKAKMMFGLFRTDPDAPKHRGISYILVPMDTPGIEANPIEQITGSRSFNEVFFEDARVPASNVVGEINRGWYVAATTLDFERSQVGSAVGLHHLLSDLLQTLEEEAEPGGYSRLGEPTLRAALAESHVEAEVARLFLLSGDHDAEPRPGPKLRSVDPEGIRERSEAADVADGGESARTLLAAIRQGRPACTDAVEVGDAQPRDDRRDDRRGDIGDPAQYHRDARPRTTEGLGGLAGLEKGPAAVLRRGMSTECARLVDEGGRSL